MAIKVQCGHCSASFKAKDQLAGKRVKCPKCTQPIVIPAARRAPNPVGAVVGHNPLLDLLDEAGVESVPQGPICDNCGSEMEPTAIVCVDCGFNMATGERLETTIYEESDEQAEAKLSDAQKIMAKAERDIEDMPITAVGQDFGDGADSFLIAIVSVVILAILIGIGISIIYLMDLIGEQIDPAKISCFASVGLYFFMVIWVTIVAFLSKPLHGVICLASGGLYCVVFGFMQGRTLMVPTVILCVSMFIGLVSAIFVFNKKPEFGFNLEIFEWDFIPMAGQLLSTIF